MPQNFSKPLETASADIAINEKKYDTSLGTMFETLGTAAGDIAESYVEARDQQRVGTFTDEMLRIEEEQAALRYQQTLVEQEAARGFEDTMAQSKTDSDRLVAREQFYSQIRDIRDLEAQRGADYGARIATVVRRYSNMYPSLTEEFQKALSFSQDVSKARKESAAVAQGQYQELYESRRKALANGMRLADVWANEDLARKNANLKAQVELMLSRGEVEKYSTDPNRPGWFTVLEDQTEHRLEMDTNGRLAQVLQYVQQTGNVAAGRAAIAGFKNEALQELESSVMMIEQASELGAYPDGAIRIATNPEVERMRKVISSYYDLQLTALTSADYKNALEGMKLQKDMSSWRAMSFLMFGTPELGPLAETIGPGPARDMLTAFNEAASVGQGATFAEIAEAQGAGGTPKARAARNALKVQLFKDFMISGEWPPPSWQFGTEENRALGAEIATAIMQDRVIREEIALQAQPFIMQALHSLSMNSNRSPELSDEAVALGFVNAAANEIRPSSKVGQYYGNDNLRNPNSVLYKNPIIQSGQHKQAIINKISQIAYPLEVLMSELPEDEKENIVFVPNQGWQFTPFTRVRRSGGARTETSRNIETSEAATWAQNLFFYEMNTVGLAEANRRGEQLYQTYFALPESTPSEVQVSGEMTPEDVQALLDNIKQNEGNE